MILLRNSHTPITDTAAVARVFQDLLRLEDRIDRDKEHFYVMHINARQQVQLVELVSVGTLDKTTIHPRETFRRAIIEGAHSILVAHNHPAGDVSPSNADVLVTNHLSQAGELLRIPLLDHLIFTSQEAQFFSFRHKETQSTLQTRRKKYAMKNSRDERG
jgi:DNA repair protein RadC